MIDANRDYEMAKVGKLAENESQERKDQSMHGQASVNSPRSRQRRPDGGALLTILRSALVLFTTLLVALAVTSQPSSASCPQKGAFASQAFLRLSDSFSTPDLNQSYRDALTFEALVRSVGNEDCVGISKPLNAATGLLNVWNNLWFEGLDAPPGVTDGPWSMLALEGASLGTWTAAGLAQLRASAAADPTDYPIACRLFARNLEIYKLLFLAKEMHGDRGILPAQLLRYYPTLWQTLNEKLRSNTGMIFPRYDLTVSAFSTGMKRLVSLMKSRYAYDEFRAIGEAPNECKK